MRLHGQPAAPGVALGPAWIFRPLPGPTAGSAPTTDLEGAVRTAVRQLTALADQIRALGRGDEAEILEAQALMAQDPMLLTAARETIDAGSAPDVAVRRAAEAFADQLAAIPDPTLAARAADVRDVGARIARILSGHRLELPERPSIALADDLPPSVTAEIPAGLLLGVVLAGGSATAHAAILARSLGIPAVVGVEVLGRLVDGNGDLSGRTVALDGGTGDVVLDPGEREVADWTARRSETADDATALLTGPVTTTDGRRVLMLANIGRPEEAQAALAAGAEGVGLFRTEFLFLGRLRPPSEDEQAAAYGRVLEAFGAQRSVVIRLADIGGDKELPYLGLPPEANPFLGVRAIRLGRDNAQLLVTQLRAILRAGALTGTVPSVSVPMVALPEDLDLVQELLAEARRSLDTGGVATAVRLRLGIMVEVPSAVVLARELARRVDFLSIGTNDLTQYLFAADRTNARLAGYQRADHPVVLRSIRAVVDGAREVGIPVAVCGELAGDPDGARLLVGLGVDELSMAPPSLGRVARAIGGSSSGQLAAAAEEALRAV